MAPAPLLMPELSIDLTVTPPLPSSSVLSRTTAWLLAWIWFTEPEPAPDPATPLPEVPLATLTAPASV